MLFVAVRKMRAVLCLRKRSRIRDLTKGQKDVTTLRRRSFHRIYAAVKRDFADGPRDRLKDEQKSASDGG